MRLIFPLLLINCSCLLQYFLYPAPPYRVPFPPPEPYREVRLKLNNGNTIIGWYIINRKNDITQNKTARPIILYFHGNGENLITMHYSGLFRQFRDGGFDFLAIDYPGYGRSNGSPSEKTLINSGATALKYLREKYSKREILVVGWSLGAAVAIQIAAKHPGKINGLAVMSPWSSLIEVASDHFPRILAYIYAGKRYNSKKACSKLNIRTLIIHGKNDKLIPVKHGKELAGVIKSEVKFVVLQGVGHNDLLSNKRAITTLFAFLRSFNKTELR